MRASRRWKHNVMPPHEVERVFGALKPCPFCGSEVVGLFAVSAMPHVTCGGCGADGPAFECRREDRDAARAEAVRAWNVRK